MQQSVWCDILKTLNNHQLLIIALQFGGRFSNLYKDANICTHTEPRPNTAVVWLRTKLTQPHLNGHAQILLPSACLCVSQCWHTITTAFAILIWPISTLLCICQFTILSREMCRDCNSGEKVELFNMNFKESGWEKKMGYPGPKPAENVNSHWYENIRTSKGHCYNISKYF